MMLLRVKNNIKYILLPGKSLTIKAGGRWGKSLFLLFKPRDSDVTLVQFTEYKTKLNQCLKLSLNMSQIQFIYHY